LLTAIVADSTPAASYRKELQGAQHGFSSFERAHEYRGNRVGPVQNKNLNFTCSSKQPQECNLHFFALCELSGSVSMKEQHAWFAELVASGRAVARNLRKRTVNCMLRAC
jgi:hypothetical protein